MERRRSWRSRLPMGASYPVQPIPELPEDAAAAQSSSRSTSTTDAPRTAHSLATERPTTPPPTTSTS
eukprot:scaffold83019_cov35-Tisochrysis_lutea.AAC.1